MAQSKGFTLVLKSPTGGVDKKESCNFTLQRFVFLC